MRWPAPVRRSAATSTRSGPLQRWAISCRRSWAAKDLDDTCSSPRTSRSARLRRLPGNVRRPEADDGRLALEAFGPTSDLGVVPPVSAPPDVLRRYKRFGALTHFIATTYSPDFPTSARLLLEMRTQRARTARRRDRRGLRVDLLPPGGDRPRRDPAWPEPINAENVSTVINHDTFLPTSHGDIGPPPGCAR